MRIFLSIIVLSMLSISCGENKNEKKESATSDKSTKTTRANDSNYILFSPNNEKNSDILFVVIDAHGEGLLAVNKFKLSANSFGFHVIGLNNVSNNEAQYLQKITSAISEAENQLNTKFTSVYLAGFSGGARMALSYAANNQSAGVIMLGAGPRNQKGFSFPLAMISGLRDFNFSEQYYSINDAKVTQTNLITLHWEGKHEWPDSSLIKEAVSFVLYQSHLIGEQDLNRKEQFKKAEKAQMNNNLFLYFKQLELVSKTSTTKLQQKVLESIIAMQKSEKAQQYFVNYRKIIDDEKTRNQLYYNNLDTKDLNWWTAKINKIDEITSSDKSTQSDSYARTRGYLGILIYSKVQSALSGKANAKLLPKYLSIYEILEPNNPDLFYFKALYAYHLGDNTKAIENLKTSLELGFNQLEKLNTAFPQMIISAAQKN